MMISGKLGWTGGISPKVTLPNTEAEIRDPEAHS